MTNTPRPSYPQETSHPPFRRPHRALTGADVKALRPLRGRAPRPSLDPDAYLSAIQHRAEKIKKLVRTTLDRPLSFRDDLRLGRSVDHIWAILRRVDGPAVHSFELGTDGPKAILVGVDGSETSMRAGAYASGLAHRQGARLVVLFVVSLSRFASMSPAALAMLYQTSEEMAKELREMAESRAEELGIALTFVTRRGDPFAEMCRMATEIKADAIVVGASTWAGHRFAGSLAVRLVKAGRWPVTVVP